MKKLKGSATVMVIISAMVFSIYSSAAISEVLSALYTQTNIEKNIKEVYEKDIENIDKVYEKLEMKLY